MGRNGVRTLDQGMNHGRDRPVLIRPVVVVDVVPMGHVGVAQSRWVPGCRGGGKQERRGPHAHGTFQPDVIDHHVNLRPLLLQRLGHNDARLLGDRQIGELAFPLVVLLGDAGVELGLQVVEALGKLIEDDFGVSIQGAETSLESGVMGMWRDVIQNGELPQIKPAWIGITGFQIHTKCANSKLPQPDPFASSERWIVSSTDPKTLEE